MSRRVRSLLILGLLLAAAGVVPAVAGAQLGPGPVFPPVGDGEWEGVVIVAGFSSEDYEAPDGSWNTTVRDVIDSTSITVSLDTDDTGDVTSGGMGVDLTWFAEGVGVSPSTFDPFRIASDHHWVGALVVSGNASELVADGTLTQTLYVQADGISVPSVSGTEEKSVRWVFSATEATCAMVTGDLVGGSGDASIINHSLYPRQSEQGGSTIHSEVIARLVLHPVGVTGIEEALAAREELLTEAQALAKDEIPSADQLVHLVAIWQEMKAELAALDSCQTEAVGWVPQSTESWLTDTLRNALWTALDNAEFYDVAELADLWDVGLSEQVLDGDLRMAFIQAMRQKLEGAVVNGDVETMLDIAAWASANGYNILKQEALAAIEAAQ